MSNVPALRAHDHEPEGSSELVTDFCQLSGVKNLTPVGNPTPAARLAHLERELVNLRTAVCGLRVLVNDLIAARSGEVPS
jgi:hypothetical protein